MPESLSIDSAYMSPSLDFIPIICNVQIEIVLTLGYEP